MNWNFTAGNFSLRLPLTEQDGDALYELMSAQSRVDHLPRLAMSVEAQALDELRRVAMRFETREAAFWLVEGLFDNSWLRGWAFIKLTGCSCLRSCSGSWRMRLICR